MRKKRRKSKEFFTANKLDTRSEKSQSKFSSATNLKQGQIYKNWPKKGQPCIHGQGELLVGSQALRF